MKNYLNFTRTKKFAELSESQNISHTHEQASILKQSDFLQIDSTKNNDTKHFFIDKDKIIEESDPTSLKSPLKMNIDSDENKEPSNFELKDILIQTNQSHILHSKEDIFPAEEHLLQDKLDYTIDKSPPLNINDLNENSDGSGKKQEILLIGKQESLKPGEMEGASEDSVVLLPPVPVNQNSSNFSSINSHNFEEPSYNGVFLRKKFSMEKKKIGFSTFTMRRDFSLFNNNNPEERENRSAESFGKMLSAGSENLEAEKYEKFPTNKKVMNELDNIEKHIILKRNVENFIILFNDKPEHGIEYLIDNNMVNIVIIIYMI